MRRYRIFALSAVGALAACEPQQPAGAGVSQVSSEPVPQVSFVLRAPEGPVPGMAVSHVQAAIKNPYDGDAGGIEEGRFLFIRMNCAYCHGFAAKGGMGPDLTDDAWRYGGADVDVFNSVYRGRAKGMPAWGPLLTESQVWKVVAYVRSLGGESGPRYVATGKGGGDQADTRKTDPGPKP